ncbi:hypothetical protein ACTFIZ_012614 [Dictyostelium cf. discoideum]
MKKKRKKEEEIEVGSSDSDTDLYAIQESIDKKSYFIFFMYLKANTSVKFEVVPSSNSKSIKVEYSFEIDEEDREKITTTLSKLGAPINNKVTNLIELEQPKWEFFLEFNDRVNWKNIERFPVTDKKGRFLTNAFKINKKVHQEIKPILFENHPIPIIFT